MSTLITAEYFAEQMATLGLKSSFAPSAYALDTLITEASDWVEDYTDRRFELVEATATVHGPIRSTGRLILPDYPVTALASVEWEDDSLQTTGADDVAGDHRLHPLGRWSQDRRRRLCP